MTFAFDAHLHLLPLKYTCASSYFAFVKQNALDESYAALFAPDYIYKGLFRNKNIIQNLLAVMENDVEHIAKLYEDDLRGHFDNANARTTEKTRHAARALTLADSGVSINSFHRDKLVLMPLIMDFSTKIHATDIYYKQQVSHDFYADIADTIEGIRRFCISRPESPCIIRPYLGINPALHTVAEIDSLLNTHFSRKNLWSPRAKYFLRTWKKLKSAKPITAYEKIPKNMFAGIKLYPPLGFDPAAQEKAQKEKLELLFSFCEKNTVPLVTHCDDQGFRMISQEKSLKYTSPKRWENVLKRYPELYLDFAHFGKQYYRGLRFKQDFDWRDKIITLMRDYPNVYADVSFSGVAQNAWAELGALFSASSALTAADVHALSEKLIFGTDWPLILWRTESALGYWEDFVRSAIPEHIQHRMLSDNPARFAFR
ncbi:MAG: amidohydrolase family protein [Treponemataceae bacterium]|nr:MAG: amidohydrolase family protein [Treponemataceae bacterium]